MPNIYFVVSFFTENIKMKNGIHASFWTNVSHYIWSIFGLLICCYSLILMCCITLIDFFHAKLSEHYWDKTISWFESMFLVSLLLSLYYPGSYCCQLYNLTKCRQERKKERNEGKKTSIHKMEMKGLWNYYLSSACIIIECSSIIL